MPSGPAMFQAVKQAIIEQDLKPREVFRIHPVDALDLCKLTSTDLRNLGFDSSLAQRISTELLKQAESYFNPNRPTELAIGLRHVILRVDPATPPLPVDPDPS